MTEKTIRETIKAVLSDDRFNLPAIQRCGDACHTVTDKISIGYSFPHTEQLNGKIKLGDSRKGWFIALYVGKFVVNVPVETKGTNASNAYSTIREALETINDATAIV